MLTSTLRTSRIISACSIMRDLHDSSYFYAADLEIEVRRADKIARFIEFARSEPAVTRAKEWAIPASSVDPEFVLYRTARVYIGFYSQNRFASISAIEKVFFCPDDVQVYFKCGILGENDSMKNCLDRFPNGRFSGARSRKMIHSFSEAFYEQAINWD